MKEKKLKARFKGVFNYRHSVWILYCYATTERGAWSKFMFQLAKKHLVEVGWVMNMFNGDQDNYSIEPIKD